MARDRVIHFSHAVWPIREFSFYSFKDASLAVTAGVCTPEHFATVRRMQVQVPGGGDDEMKTNKKTNQKAKRKKQKTTNNQFGEWYARLPLTVRIKIEELLAAEYGRGWLDGAAHGIYYNSYWETRDMWMRITRRR